MNTFWFTMLMIALAGGMVLLSLYAHWYYHRRFRKVQQGVIWQLEKMERASEGWRPVLWDEDDPTVTQEEKYAALLAYAAGKPIPATGRAAHQHRSKK